MRLSRLQKYILEKCYLSKSKGGQKVDFYDFYSKKELKKNHRKSRRQGGASGAGKKIIQDVIHKSLDSLVVKDLLIAIGKKTAKKWYIKKVRLTASGKRLARELIKSKQLKLKIK